MVPDQTTKESATRGQTLAKLSLGASSRVFLNVKPSSSVCMKFQTPGKKIFQVAMPLIVVRAMSVPHYLGRLRRLVMMLKHGQAHCEALLRGVLSSWSRSLDSL
jgi:hypothetical protein